MKRMKEIDAYFTDRICKAFDCSAGTWEARQGEFVEIVKKMFLQGKPADEDNIYHMKRELGDIMWYWATACMALKLDPYEVIKENQDKLEARYGEKFEVDRSEHRKDGDL